MWTTVENIVTNGPFKVESWHPDRLLILSRNPRYTGRFTGNLDRIELSTGEDPSTRVKTYEANALDAVTCLDAPPLGLDRVRQKIPEEYVSTLQLSTLCMFFTADRPPFDNPRVRRAFSLATDRETLTNVVLRGYHLPTTGVFLPPGMPGHSAGTALPYNPAQARQLLAQAGYKVGDEPMPSSFGQRSRD